MPLQIQQYITLVAKGAGNPVGFIGSLSVSHINYTSTGTQRVQQKFLQKMTLPAILHQQHMGVHNLD